MKFLFVFLIVLPMVGLASEAQSNWEASCTGMLAKLASVDTKKEESKDAGKATTRDLRITALTEKHQLTDLFKDNAKFVLDHPSIVMNAAQRTLALVQKAGVTEEINPKTGNGKVKVYNLFSRGLPSVDFNRVVGHYDVIEVVMANLEAAAQGNTSGLYPPLIVGPPATGKTVFLKIPDVALEKALLESPEEYQYTYSWKNLEQVPVLESLFNDLRGSAKGLVISSPMNESPFVLLPKELQDGLLAEVGKTVAKRIKGYTPNPKRVANRQDRYILDQIIMHMSQKKGSALTSLEIVKGLNDFVEIKRVIPDGRKFLIPAQQKEVDTASLFFKQHPMAGVYGADHPFAYHITGLIPGANGRNILFDEVGKNQPQLIAKFLNLIQDRVVSDGAISEPVDFWAIFATNNIDIQNIRAADKQSPFLSRTDEINQAWHVHPQLIAKTMMYEMPNVKVQKLGDANAPVEIGMQHLDEVFPEVPFGHRVPTIDGRYRAFTGEGEHRVDFSPHAIMYVADIVALSRMKFDAKEEDYKKFKWPDIASVPSMLRDEISRLKGFMGETDVQASVASQYDKFSKHFGEGNFGFDHRHVTKWMGFAIKEAEKTENGNAVTPLLLKRTLEVYLSRPAPSDDPSMKIDEGTKVLLLNYAEAVAKNIIFPKIKEDVMKALAESSDETAGELYDGVIQTITALHRDPNATEYTDAGSNTVIKITEAKKKELEKIRAIYKQQQRRDLSYAEISAWHDSLILSHRRSRGNTEENTRRVFGDANPGIMAAIVEYQATNISLAHQTTTSRFLKISTGEITAEPAEQQRAIDFINKLKNDLGYSEGSLREALQIVSEEAQGMTP